MMLITLLNLPLRLYVTAAGWWDAFCSVWDVAGLQIDSGHPIQTIRPTSQDTCSQTACTCVDKMAFRRNQNAQIVIYWLVRDAAVSNAPLRLSCLMCATCCRTPRLPETNISLFAAHNVILPQMQFFFLSFCRLTLHHGKLKTANVAVLGFGGGFHHTQGKAEGFPVLIGWRDGNNCTVFDTLPAKSNTRQSVQCSLKAQATPNHLNVQGW